MNIEPRVFWTGLSIFFTVGMIVCYIVGWQDPVLLLTLFVFGFMADLIFYRVSQNPD